MAFLSFLVNFPGRIRGTFSPGLRPLRRDVEWFFSAREMVLFLRSDACDVQGDFDIVGDFIFVFAGFDSEVTAFDGEF